MPYYVGFRFGMMNKILTKSSATNEQNAVKNSDNASNIIKIFLVKSSI